MRVVGEFNNLSDMVKDKIIPLKPGESAEYQLLECVRIQDPQTSKIETRYPHRMWYSRDTIYDPGKETTVDIGVISPGGVDVKTQTVTQVEKYEFDRPRDGILYLSGDILFHRELHEILQLTNHCQDGVMDQLQVRDAAKPYHYKLIDRRKEAKARNKLRDIKADALVYVRNMEAEDMRDFAASMNWDYKGDLDEISEKIGEFADKDPVAFNKVIVDPLQKKKAVIKKAMGTIITYDAMQHRILWANGQVVATLERKANQTEVDAFAEWLSTVANGDKIFQQLRQKKPAAQTAD